MNIFINILSILDYFQVIKKKKKWFEPLRSRGGGGYPDLSWFDHTKKPFMCYH